MSARKNILLRIESIEAEDLHFVEQDLCFYEKVSIGFLLFADEKANAHLILQKLLVLSKSRSEASDILISYTKINSNWKPFVVEALAIIKANKVLRKLGLPFNDVRTHFLPHIPEMSLHINPILKALYSMCEMLTPIQASNLVQDIRDRLLTEASNDHFRFYEFEYLEMFLLDWITRRILNASGTVLTNISLLVDYLKLNDMTKIRNILTHSLHSLRLEVNDTEKDESVDLNKNRSKDTLDAAKEKVFEAQPRSVRPSSARSNDCYKIRRESAGFVLIINQKTFHRTTDPELQALLPETDFKERLGTDIDKAALEKTFSSFGYKPIVRDDLDHIGVLENMREVVRRSIMYDSLIVCILTHGKEGSVYASDSVPIKIDEIERILTGESIANKPKMLIIQACQGNTMQKARNSDGELESDGLDDAADYGDMIRAMSTVPGFASLRHTMKGSWFIQTLCAKIDELGDSDHMLEILTEVNCAISQKRGTKMERMTSISSQTLTKKFRLPSR